MRSVGYLFIAHKISVFTVNGYIDKLNKKISAEDVTTILCTDEFFDDVVTTTTVAFSGKEVFVRDSEDNGYKLNTEIQNGNYLMGDLTLSGVQVASIINFLAEENGVVGHFCVDDRDVNLSALNIKLAELDMQNSTPTTCDMKMVFEVDFVLHNHFHMFQPDVSLKMGLYYNTAYKNSPQMYVCFL